MDSKQTARLRFRLELSFVRPAYSWVAQEFKSWINIMSQAERDAMDSKLKGYMYVDDPNGDCVDFKSELLYTDRLSNSGLLDLCLNKKIHHIVQKSNLDTSRELRVSSDLIEQPEKFFQFPFSIINNVERPCEDSENRLRQLKFSPEKASDKDSLLRIIEDYVIEITKSKTLLGDVLNTADELFTNAIYNAPFVNQENSHSGIERDFENVEINPLKRPVVYLGHDHEKIDIGCSDYYGSLNITSMLKRLRRCVGSNLAEMINYGKGGAGIGSYLIFESSCVMYLAVQKSRQTTICCSFPYKLSSKERSVLPKNIHIIDLE